MRTRTLIVAALAIGAGIGAYFGGRSSEPGYAQPLGPQAGRGPQSNLTRWLDLSDEQAAEVASADPTFASDSQALAGALQQERDTLSALLEDPQTPGDAILAQVDKVIAADGALERRVAEHVVAIRKELTADQARRLMGLVAQQVRRQHRYGMGQGMGGGQGRGPAPGMGPGMGRGGRGMGPGRRLETQPTTAPDDGSGGGMRLRRGRGGSEGQ